MQQATTIHPILRAKWGLPALAESSDYQYSLESSGAVTDVYRVEASKVFNTPYDAVTPHQIKAIKSGFFG